MGPYPFPSLPLPISYFPLLPFHLPLPGTNPLPHPARGLGERCKFPRSGAPTRAEPRPPSHVSLWAHETRLVIAILGHSRLQKKRNFKYDGLLNISLLLMRNITPGKSRDWRLIYKWQVQVTSLCAFGFLRATAYMSRQFRLSVCVSVRHTRALYQNGWT